MPLTLSLICLSPCCPSNAISNGVRKIFDGSEGAVPTSSFDPGTEGGGSSPRRRGRGSTGKSGGGSGEGDGDNHNAKLWKHEGCCTGVPTSPQRVWIGFMGGAFVDDARRSTYRECTAPTLRLNADVVDRRTKDLLRVIIPISVSLLYIMCSRLRV